MGNFLPSRISAVIIVFSLACSAASDPPGGVDDGNGGSSQGGSGGIITGGTAGQNTGGTNIITQGGASGSGGSSGDTCATRQADATIVTEPVDIIVVLDNSGSMHEEMGAAEANINVNFSQILDRGGVDYRMILISRHRQGPRTTGESEANTSICVEQPLSGLAQCPSELPVFTDRFFQFGMKVESTDSFDRVLEWYNSPDEENDLAPNGWSEWLRVGAKKVFVEMTDDNEDMPATTFIQQLTALSAEHFGTPAAPNFTFHTIMGIREKADPTAPWLPSEGIVNETCTGNGAQVENPGQTYQELSIATQGLRFPLCQFPGYDAVFTAIANDVIVTSSIECDFDIPPPPEGSQLALDRVAVSYTPGASAAPIELGQAATPADCGPDAFYIESDRVQLCEEACTAIKEVPGASVDVLFKCESTIIVR